MLHQILQFLLAMAFSVIGGLIAVLICIAVGIIDEKGGEKDKQKLG